MLTRRGLLELSVAGVVASGVKAQSAVPWYRKTVRWGQTNITERDPTRYDIAWWREYWKRTFIQGVIINAGGIVAYYPSKFPLQHRAEFLGEKDLYGELVAAARQDGLAVVARMDSNRTSEDFFSAHPDWFCRRKSGEPYRAEDKFITCVNSAYYDEYLPGVLSEIIERSHPDGFADNSWSGLGRESICYCQNCSRKFRDQVSQPLPAEKNWDNAVYRQWINWNYKRRIEVWDLNNRVTKSAGGPHCLWMGMNSGSVTAQSNSFRDLKQICERSEMLLLDHQSRTESTGFQQNAQAGKLVHGLLGWNKLAPESMALYQAASRPGETSFRVASKPPLEARMWMIEGFAGGIQPWWHHVGAYHEDRRMYHTAEAVFAWYKQHEQYLLNREPVASVGVVWSQTNTDFYGRDQAAELVDVPYRGITEALLRARIPYQPVNADHIERDGKRFATLVLPALGALSDAQCASIQNYVQAGGSLVATGPTSLYNEWGDRRGDFGLAGLFGVHAPAEDPSKKFAGKSFHTYLRLSPELRKSVWGPKGPGEPDISGNRHPVLQGFEETDILPFGGMVEAMQIESKVEVPLTFIPAFPIYPPETAWMRTPKTDIPGLVLNRKGQSRIAYFPANIDTRYGHDNLPDHARLLANTIRWAAGNQMPLQVSGPGLIDCHLYHQGSRLILHLVNLSNEAAWRAPMEELIPVGPLQIKVKLPGSAAASSVKALVSGAQLEPKAAAGWTSFQLRSLADHEVLVIA